MRPSLRLSWFALALLVAGGARGATFLDDFEGGNNAASWAFLRGGDTLESSGGNPGGWLHQPVYDTFAPSVVCALDNGTPFVGDYRAAGVSRLSFDLNTLHTDFPTGDGFYVTVILRSIHGTPDNIDDDDLAYFTGPVAPTGGQGWVHFSVDIPSQSTDPTPSGWSGAWVGDCSTFRPGVDWNDVIANVDLLEISWLPPCYFAIFQQWNVGVDNIEIEYVDNPVPIQQSSFGRVKRLYQR